MSGEVLVYYHDDMLAHHPTGWDPGHPEWTEAVQALLAEVYPDRDPESWIHPERPERLECIRDHLREAGPSGVVWQSFDEAAGEHLRRVHTDEHVDFINSLRGRSCWLSQDTTAVSPDSVRAANLAAGAGVAAVDAVLGGDSARAFCLVRPPGHHAMPERAMGFCLFNNIAVAAAHALSRDDCRRVLVFDWDLHHGNGTQEIFYRNPDVMLVDTHCAAPFYPGTGLLEETGEDAGRGTTRNVPLPAGSGDTAMLAAVERILVPVAERFRPELILVSAGFDSHELDQTMAMTYLGFGQLCARVCRVADDVCDGRLVLMLEGGYHAEALAGGTEACIRAMAGEPTDETEWNDDDPGLPAVEEAAAHHRL